MTEVKEYLDQWGLSHLWERFEEQGIDFEAFIHLTDDLIKALIEKIGDQAKFLSYFKNFKRTNLLDIGSVNVEYISQTPIPIQILQTSPSTSTSQADTLSFENLSSTCSSPSTSSFSESLEDFVEDKALEEIPVPYKRQNAFLGDYRKETEPLTYDFDLKKLLHKSITGRQILQTDNLTSNLRNNLVSIIVNEELRIHSDKRIPTARFIQLARHIKQLFPKESLATYYTPYQHVKGKFKRCAKGKLFDKYHNVRRSLRTSGILSENPSNDEQGSVDQDNIVEEHIPDNENIDDLILWLKNNYEPWPTVVEHWQKTCKTRLKTYTDSQSTIFEYLKTFPALTRPLGYTLFELDFKSLFPQQEYNLYSKINEFSTKIFQLAKKSKDPNVIKFITHLRDNDSEDGRNAVTFLCLPYLLQTHLVATKKAKWRPSKIECQETFLLHIATVDELDATLERQRNKFVNKCDTLQPLPIAIGNFNNLVCMISVDSVLYKVESVMKALDICFKIYHVLHAAYPSPSQHIWQLIQTYIYEINDAEHDKNYIAINTFLTYLNEA